MFESFNKLFEKFERLTEKIFGKDRPPDRPPGCETVAIGHTTLNCLIAKHIRETCGGTVVKVSYYLRPGEGLDVQVFYKPGFRDKKSG